MVREYHVAMLPDHASISLTPVTTPASTYLVGETPFKDDTHNKFVLTLITNSNVNNRGSCDFCFWAISFVEVARSWNLLGWVVHWGGVILA